MEDKRKPVNGTAQWMERARPLVALAVAVGLAAFAAGMWYQKINQLDSRVTQLSAEVELLKINAMDKGVIQGRLDNANAYSTNAVKELSQLKALLISQGVLK